MMSSAAEPQGEPLTVPSSDAATSQPRGLLCVVTGATGYIGGRLIPELLEAGHRVRAVARNPDALRDRRWHDQVEVVRADATDPDQVAKALQGADVAYYLIHALGSGSKFETKDRETARIFATAAKSSAIGRLVYLGGMHPSGEDLSPHLESRREVGEILLAGGVPTTVLQAAVIIGSGSASFEMMRYLTERLPVMVAPRWLDNLIQPIAVRDVLRYLVGSATMPSSVTRAFDIGGPDVLTYRQMMQRYAQVSGLPPRLIRTLPVLTPRLASLWVGLVTPVPSGLARPLVESLIHEVVSKESDIETFIAAPDGLINFDRAVELALQRVREYDVSTTWSSASYRGAPSDPLPQDPSWAGGDLYVDERASIVEASSETLWKVIEGVGGANGWYSWRLGWAARGLMDRVFGGPGLRRGRRHPTDLSIGDALDWWRVEAIEDQHLLRLRAEMRLPGLAWLELIAETDDEDRTVFRQRAIYHPQGFLGRVYWWVISPFHGIVFGGMQRNIAKAAERATDDRRPG